MKPETKDRLARIGFWILAAIVTVGGGKVAKSKFGGTTNSGNRT